MLKDIHAVLPDTITKTKAPVRGVRAGLFEDEKAPI
jgi:hypothetical protein